MENVRLLWHGLEHGRVDLRRQSQQLAATLGALLIDAKGVFDAMSGSESAG